VDNFPGHRSAQAREGSGAGFHGLDADASQERVEGRGELPDPVPDREPEIRGAIAEVHQQAADLL